MPAAQPMFESCKTSIPNRCFKDGDSAHVSVGTILGIMSKTKAQPIRMTRDESPEREQRRQMALRHVRQYPDPVLRRVAFEVVEFDEELIALSERMINIMQEAYGVGLAAPQLGLLLRMFTYQFDENSAPESIVNPVIESASDETDDDDEGCLSLGDLRVCVTRPIAIAVSGKTVEGDDVSHEFEGFAARVFQHEIDHLDGVLAFDRASTDDDRRASLNYLRPKP